MGLKKIKITIVIKSEHRVIKGEQTYCRKWVFDKMPKIVLGHNGEKIFPKLRLGLKCRIFSFLILISFYLQFV